MLKLKTNQQYFPIKNIRLKLVSFDWSNGMKLSLHLMAVIKEPKVKVKLIIVVCFCKGNVMTFPWTIRQCCKFQNILTRIENTSFLLKLVKRWMCAKLMGNINQIVTKPNIYGINQIFKQLSVIWWTFALGQMIWRLRKTFQSSCKAAMLTNISM